MIDPRLISSGIQTGRTLAPQGPPIQEMLGMKMQQNQAIAEIMKELLKAHMSDVSDLRKTQWTMAYKGLTDPNLEPKEQQAAYDRIMNMDVSKWLGYKSILGGFGGGKDTTGATDTTGGAAEVLTPKTPETPVEKPSFANKAGSFMGNAAMAPLQAAGAPMAGFDALMQGLKRPGATTPGKDQYGYTIGQTYKGYKYIGNNQWQKS